MKGVKQMDDRQYIDGMEMGVDLVKRIYELTADERIEKFGATSVPEILDTFDFAELFERMNGLNKYFVIRGIKDTKIRKEVIAESGRLKFPPDETMIMAFMNIHKEADFAVVEEIYAKE